MAVVPELGWQKSSYSGDASNCLYVADGGDGTVRMRESEEPQVVLAVPRGRLRGFLSGVKAGGPGLRGVSRTS